MNHSERSTKTRYQSEILVQDFNVARYSPYHPLHGRTLAGHTPTYTKPSPLGQDTAQGQPQWYEVLDNALQKRQHLEMIWILPELIDNEVTLRPKLPFECAFGSIFNITRSAPRGPSNQADPTASHEHNLARLTTSCIDYVQRGPHATTAMSY
ncbi:hypothetical protein N7481_009336 [Penicillium waksmanii]|uniref:uncharacterized protein n=1 Tax=Penicillium waksmanii TaxID=69791 RepID=UPI002549711A|nr:uncharacterized protein N7481_009336 [Penicillium waksmanii]KAJ5975629.1 hypothetical protein N7481_009336 [Penicillium waksmanii]